jgi:hypothetical protein
MQIPGEYLNIIIVAIVLLVQIVAQWVWVKHELQTLRKESEAMDNAIELKRETNVSKLREIYDLKIADNRAHALSLFERSESQFKTLNDNMEKFEIKLDKLIDVLIHNK